MSSTRHISKQDLIGSPSIEVAREGNVLSPGGIQTEAKERHDGMQLRADRGSAGQALPGQSRHDEDDAQAESRRNIQRMTRVAHRRSQTFRQGRDLRSGKRASTSSVKEEDGA